MGFYYHAISLPKSIPTIAFFLNVLSHAGFLFIAVLTRLGLHKPPPPEEEEEDSGGGNYILMLQGSSHSLVPIPVGVVTAAIKARVPVIQYGEFLRRRGLESCEQQKASAACGICLEFIEWTDEIREPCICSRPFHKACLDGWIDVGKVNCPLCRAMLLPPNTNIFTCMKEYQDAPLFCT